MTRTNKQLLEQILKDHLGERVRANVFVGTDLFGEAYNAQFLIDQSVVVQYLRIRPSISLSPSVLSVKELMHHIVMLSSVVSQNPVLDKAYLVIIESSGSEHLKDFIRNQRHVEHLTNGKVIELIEFTRFTNMVVSGKFPPKSS